MIAGGLAPPFRRIFLVMVSDCLVPGDIMDTLIASYRGFRTLLRLNIDWLRFAVIVMIALYSGSYVMLS